MDNVVTNIIEQYEIMNEDKRLEGGSMMFTIP